MGVGFEGIWDDVHLIALATPASWQNPESQFYQYRHKLTATQSVRVSVPSKPDFRAGGGCPSTLKPKRQNFSSESPI